MGNKNFPNVNLILSICQLIVYLTIYLPISRKKVSLYEKNVKMCQFYSDSSRFFLQPTVLLTVKLFRRLKDNKISR
jgi:hypothetical protein